jgi:hypothetical protein
MVTILWYVHGQEQKFKDAPKVTAFPESLVFPQIKKTAWMEKEKRKLVLRQHSLKSFSEDLSTVLHNTKRVKTDEWKTVCAVLYHLKLSLDTMSSYLKRQSAVAVTNHSSIVPARPAEMGLDWYSIDASSGRQSDVRYTKSSSCTWRPSTVI